MKVSQGHQRKHEEGHQSAWASVGKVLTTLLTVASLMATVLVIAQRCYPEESRVSLSCQAMELKERSFLLFARYILEQSGYEWREGDFLLLSPVVVVECVFSNDGTLPAKQVKLNFSEKAPMWAMSNTAGITSSTDFSEMEIEELRPGQQEAILFVFKQWVSFSEYKPGMRLTHADGVGDVTFAFQVKGLRAQVARVMGLHSEQFFVGRIFLLGLFIWLCLTVIIVVVIVRGWNGKLMRVVEVETDSSD